MGTIKPDPISDAASGHRASRMSGRNSIEVLVRADRRRLWAAGQKREIARESLDLNGAGCDAARKHGITTGQLYTRRREAVNLHKAVRK